jgi:CheY-like chemotaxis protein
MKKDIFNLLTGNIPKADITSGAVNRIVFEQKVRVAKRQGGECPYKKDNMCSKIDIRCGERQKFTSEYVVSSKRMMFKCNYNPNIMLDNTNIMIVDDEELIRDLCKEYLVRYGIARENIITANNSTEAINILTEAKENNNSFYLIITDIRLGATSGYDLVDEVIRRNYNAYVILMSGFADEYDKPEGYLGDSREFQQANPVVGFIDKPFTMNDFFTHISKLKEKTNIK